MYCLQLSERRSRCSELKYCQRRRFHSQKLVLIAVRDKYNAACAACFMQFALESA